jgi:hypothetical protein
MSLHSTSLSQSNPGRPLTSPTCPLPLRIRLISHVFLPFSIHSSHQPLSPSKLFKALLGGAEVVSHDLEGVVKVEVGMLLRGERLDVGARGEVGKLVRSWFDEVCLSEALHTQSGELYASRSETEGRGFFSCL